MSKLLELPPLRLVLNRECNGRCWFCHHEGYSDDGMMPMDMVINCAEAARELGVARVSLTGGEPTMRADIKEVIEQVQSHKADVSLTTNGFDLKGLAGKISCPISCLNLSISSMNPEIAVAYQNVDPSDAIQAMKLFPAERKILNIVVTNNNISEIGHIIRMTADMGLSSIDLMVLQGQEQYYQDKVSSIINFLINEFGGKIVFGTTLMMEIMNGGGNKIRIKSSGLNNLIHNVMCSSCAEKERCFEKACAVRVYPDGTVSPCLSNRVLFREEKVVDGIRKAYECLQDGMMLDRMLLG